MLNFGEGNGYKTYQQMLDISILMINMIYMIDVTKDYRFSLKA